MAEAAVTFLLEQLKEVVVAYADLIGEAESEFEQLNHDLDLLKAFLKQMAKNKKKDEMLKLLKRRIRVVVYEVEDTIDTCLTKAIQLKARNHPILGCLTDTNNSAGLALAKEVRALIEQKLAPLYKDAEKFAIMRIIADGARIADEPSTDMSTRDTLISQNRVIGFDAEEAEIIDHLTQSRDKLDVMSIVGIPGQGKTTLAWKIYQNKSICTHFHIRIWVSISQVFNSKDVFLQILKKFSSTHDTSSLNDDELAQTVHSCLKNEKFLLVLDDVWSVDAWKKIQAVLPSDNVEGKVLITTREKAVGEESKVFTTPHYLNLLALDKSWELLQHEVFGDLNKCPENLKAIGEQIANKCDGVPLMIVLIGGILKTKLLNYRFTVEQEWTTIAQSVSEALQHRAKHITQVVELSYHILPDDLRECFVFLGVFPEDYEIPAKMLCGLWISEGFVLPRRGRSIEESAEENMNDLISRNLLKVEKTNHMGKVKTCRVHDMIRAFCISIIKDENLCDEVIPSSDIGELEPSGSQLQKSRRLCFRSDLSTFLSKNPSGPHVRSFLCFYERSVKLESKYLAVIPDGFRKLRILEFKCIELEQFPGNVVKLVHLRYLTLYIETLKAIPGSITQLWNLQSLVVETKSPSITMKADLWRMVRLRYLKTSAAIFLDSTKSDGEAGQNLHTLKRLAPGSCTDVVSKKAVNLKSLGISGKLASIFENNFLQKLHHLQNLKLYEQPSEDMLCGRPLRSRFPPNLKRLTLMNTSLEWKHISTLAMIKTLEALKLKDNAFVGVTWNLGSDTFLNLQLLLIVQADLFRWKAMPGACPNLRFLVVKKCENLQAIPECLGTNLETLEIENVRSDLVQSAVKIEEQQKQPRPSKNEVPLKLIVGPVAAALMRHEAA
ncbi:putative late blight resistance protein homolog R1A-10 isoform X1 [Salvia splendens]|uniref:putative late blight resistance protein homolog R1A-10 isoform X1 n=1 Tax=Salvia splendens TaxID=180675 RepID=UPI001C26BB3A|nr:putative late blight resistance protein homolog R1A-10 isoform X1 [Salvia splendens]